MEGWGLGKGRGRGGGNKACIAFGEGLKTGIPGYQATPVPLVLSWQIASSNIAEVVVVQ